MRWSPGSTIFGLAVGLLVAVSAYRWATSPDSRSQRLTEEAVVAESRGLLIERLQLEAPEIVDPLAPRRSVGKTYVYPTDGGWEVSGFYRRDGRDEWHAFLMSLDVERKLLQLRVQDDDPWLARLAEGDDSLEVLP